MNRSTGQRTKEKEKERFYLLPGQGGGEYRRKRRVFVTWSAITALVFSGVLAAVLYLLNRPPH